VDKVIGSLIIGDKLTRKYKVIKLITKAT
jgi:hypothetical protein